MCVKQRWSTVRQPERAHSVSRHYANQLLSAVMKQASKRVRVFDEFTPHHDYLGPFIIAGRETTLGLLSAAGYAAVLKFIDDNVGRDDFARDRVHQR